MHSGTAGNTGSFVLVGAALNSANLGVSALSLATVLGLHKRLPQARITVFDFGRGLRKDAIAFDGENVEIGLYGSVGTLRVYRRESIYNMALSSALGGCGHPGLRLIREADAVLDISGGDSFSDIYGPWIFTSVTLRKRIALHEKARLCLLPQTYGPFRSPRARRIARAIVRGAALAWARDAHSYEVLRDLLGDAYDPARHRLGVDVAFGLPEQEPPEEALAPFASWLGAPGRPVAGINVSGLLLNRPDAAAEQYGLRADYRAVVVALVRRLLSESEARVLLVPHVVPPPGYRESDIAACEAVRAEVGADAERVAVCPALHDPREAKWVIARCDWFCGTRMHSTIAALSSGVPCAAIAYSPKTLGVFESCSQGEHVADPRRLETGEMTERLWQSWMGRGEARASLHAHLPGVLRQAEEQMDETVAAFVRPRREPSLIGGNP